MAIRNPPSSEDVRAVAQSLSDIAAAITAHTAVIAGREAKTEPEDARKVATVFVDESWGGIAPKTVRDALEYLRVKGAQYGIHVQTHYDGRQT